MQSTPGEPASNCYCNDVIIHTAKYDCQLLSTMKQETKMIENSQKQHKRISESIFNE